MAKILKFRDNGIVVIGKDDKSIIEARRKDFNFEPQIGDEVEIYGNENEIFISKKYVEENSEQSSEKDSKIEDNKINFDANNLNNDNNSYYDSSDNNNYNSNNSNNDKFEYSAEIDKKLVGKLEYCLFACLLGGLGIHKFYAGKVGMGILYILFCWTGIPSIVGLIEGILAIGKPVDSNGNILV